MSETDPTNNAFDRLRAIKPDTPGPIERPDAATFVRSLEGRRSGPSRSSRRLAGLVAAGVALVVGVAIWIGVSGDSGPDTVDIVDDPSTTTIASTTTAPSTTASPTTEPLPQIDAASRLLLQQFEARFNAGDVDAFMALFPTGFDREVVVDRDRRLYSLDTIEDIYAIEVVLNTEITLDCEPVGDRFDCEVLRYDDLHRILGVEPTNDPAWVLRFDDAGLVNRWSEFRENQPGAAEYESVHEPYLNWLLANHPDSPAFITATAGEWTLDRREEIRMMVDAFAESRGVRLEE